MRKCPKHTLTVEGVEVVQVLRGLDQAGLSPLFESYQKVITLWPFMISSLGPEKTQLKVFYVGYKDFYYYYDYLKTYFLFT